VGDHWSFEPVREKTPQAIDIPVCYPTPNACPRTKWSADKPNHAHRLLHLIVQLESVCPLSSSFRGPKSENHTSNSSHRRHCTFKGMGLVCFSLKRAADLLV